MAALRQAPSLGQRPHRLEDIGARLFLQLRANQAGADLHRPQVRALPPDFHGSQTFHQALTGEIPLLDHDGGGLGHRFGEPLEQELALDLERRRVSRLEARGQIEEVTIEGLPVALDPFAAEPLERDDRSLVRHPGERDEPGSRRSFRRALLATLRRGQRTRHPPPFLHRQFGDHVAQHQQPHVRVMQVAQGILQPAQLRQQRRTGHYLLCDGLEQISQSLPGDPGLVRLVHVVHRPDALEPPAQVLGLVAQQ